MTDLIRLILIFVVILGLLRFRVGIGIALLIASVALGLEFRLSIHDLLASAYASSSDIGTIDLLAALIFILFLENLMRKTLILQRMVSAVTTLARDRRLAMALLPAFVGLLPSVGGAMFSAPMVEEASAGMEMTAERKTFINYWYRHLWEYILPIYPSVILISQIVHVPMSKIIATQFPLTIAAMVAGIPLAFGGIDRASSRMVSSVGRQSFLNLAIGLGPIVTVMFLVMVLNFHVSLALLTVLIVLFIAYRYTPTMIVQLAKEAFKLDIVLLVFGVMIFKGILAQTGAVQALPPYLASIGVPIIAVVFILPFVVGLMTGIAQAPVAITIPIIAGLASTGAVDLRLIAFGFASGFAGVMMSPTHMCFVLTVRHFQSDFGKVVRMVVPSEALILGIGAAIFFIR